MTFNVSSRHRALDSAHLGHLLEDCKAGAVADVIFVSYAVIQFLCDIISADVSLVKLRL